MPGLDFFDKVELGRFLPWTNFPVMKSECRSIKRLPDVKENKLFNIRDDYPQTKNLTGGEMENKYKKILMDAMKNMDAPEWQYERVGL